MSKGGPTAICAEVVDAISQAYELLYALCLA